MEEKKVEEQAPSPEVVQPQVEPAADDDTQTVYGMTVGEIVKDRDGIYIQLREANQSIEDKNEQLLKQSARIQKLELEAKAKSPSPVPVAPNPETHAVGFDQVFVRMNDGSIKVMITVSPDVAAPLLEQAAGAGEAPQTFIQRQVEEALVAYTCS